MPTKLPRPRVSRHRLLAAPFVATAVVSMFGCGESPAPANPEPHWNPGPPQEEPTPVASASASASATATASPTATTTSAPVATTTSTPVAADTSNLPDPPKDQNGRVEKQADGTCMFVFYPHEMHCPPGAHCNPGPPQEPIKVKCPSGAAPKK